MTIREIENLDADEVQPYARLTERQLRAEEGLFIAEGVQVITQALNAGYEPVSFLMERKHIEGKAREILSRCHAPVYTSDSGVLEQLTGFALTRGVLCAMKRKSENGPHSGTTDAICMKARRIAVLESLIDPSNVGALFRNAAALGADAVLLTPDCCDPLHRKALRAGMGSVFHVPWAYLSQAAASGPDGWAAYLHGMGFTLAALALDNRAVSITDPVLHRADRLAVVLGTEGSGLRPDTVAACDRTVMIPMSGGVDSLNVAAAGAVAFWELFRTR